MKTCPYCESEITDNYFKCKYCGEYIVDKNLIRICPYCESEISSTAKKCRYCGEWLDSNKDQFNSTTSASNGIYSYSFVNDDSILKNKKNKENKKNKKNKSYSCGRLLYFFLSLAIFVITPFLVLITNAFIEVIENTYTNRTSSLYLSVILSVFLFFLLSLYRLKDIGISKFRSILLFTIPTSSIALFFIPSKIKEKFNDKSEFEIVIKYLNKLYLRFFYIGLILYLFGLHYFGYKREIIEISKPIFEVGLFGLFLIGLMSLIKGLYNKYFLHKNIVLNEIFKESKRFFLILLLFIIIFLF